jgi:NAD(P)-dependent dehydrogenase (short-subunit alcohol dehydrogenase family)
MPRARAASKADTPLSVSEETWDAMSGINLRSGFFLAREVGRHMVERGAKGRILLITSQHREMARNLPHHSASKADMTMVMKELARVLAPSGIRINAIAPGAIPGGGFVADNLGGLVAQIPLGHAGTPARRMTSHKWLSRSCQKDLVVMSLEPR